MYRKLLHFFMGFVLWCVFAYYWYLVGKRPLNEHTRLALVVIGVLVLITFLAVVWWVLHNLRIHRKLQRRKTRPLAAAPLKQDFLGRWVVADDEEALDRAAYIEIEIRGEEKVYRVKNPPGTGR